MENEGSEPEKPRMTNGHHSETCLANLEMKAQPPGAQGGADRREHFGGGMLCMRGRPGVPQLGVRGLARKRQEAAPHMGRSALRRSTGEGRKLWALN